MSSIIRLRDTFHGISVFGRGVFTNAEHGETYAGQCRDGHACGLGVLTWSDGPKIYAEHGPDGQVDGRYVDRSDEATWYVLYERRKRKDCASVYADGRCKYNNVDCAPDDPRLLALIAQVLPVEVRPAAPARHPQSPATRLQSKRPMRRLVLPTQALADAMATEVHPTPHAAPGGRVRQANHRRNATRDHAVTRSRAGST